MSAYHYLDYTIPEWVSLGLAVYAVTFLITVSHIFLLPRLFFRIMASKAAPFFIRKSSSGEHMLDDPEEDDGGYAGYDFITCAMCVGFWVTVVLWFFSHVTILEGLAAYGLSYFLKTRELP